MLSNLIPRTFSCFTLGRQLGWRRTRGREWSGGGTGGRRLDGRSGRGLTRLLFPELECDKTLGSLLGILGDDAALLEDETAVEKAVPIVADTALLLALVDAGRNH